MIKFYITIFFIERFQKKCTLKTSYKPCLILVNSPKHPLQVTTFSKDKIFCKEIIKAPQKNNNFIFFRWLHSNYINTNKSMELVTSSSNMSEQVRGFQATHFSRRPSLDPACPPFLKPLFPLPSFLFHPF